MTLQTLTCQADPPHEWQRPKKNGRAPNFCPDHQAEAADRRAQQVREACRRQPKPDTRGYREWRPQAESAVLMEQVKAIIEEYNAQLPLTCRQIFYRLVGAYGYEKTERAAVHLNTKLVRARRAKLIPFDVIRDDGLVAQSAYGYRGVDAWFEATKRDARNYRSNHQEGQDQFVELWCEAAGMVPQLANVTREFSIPVYSGGGFNSVTTTHGAAWKAGLRDVPTVILHVGDFDPSGETIYTALIEDIEAFADDDTVIEGRRIALTAEQVDEYALDTAPPKDSKHAANWTGETCQLEALPPDTIAGIVREAIDELIDDDALQELLATEQEDRETIIERLGDV
jgi:hypothetical protein